MPDLMVYKYGSFQHLDGEVIGFSFEKLPHMTDRGARDYSVLRAELLIRALGEDWEEIKAREKAICDAYAFNGREFGLFCPDGTTTKNYMPASGPNVIVPPYIAKGPIMPTGEREEYVTKRDIQVVLESIVADPESQIVAYTETIRHVGNCGPQWVSHKTLVNTLFYSVYPASTQWIIQSGASIGFAGYYLAGAVPILPSQYEHMERRVDIPGKPKRWTNWVWGSPVAVQGAYYPWEWEYVFETPIPWLLTPP